MDNKQVRIEICGGIAAGKTTLSKLLPALGFYPVYEEFEVNPFLEEFYITPDLFSFETEISFLLQHYHSIKKTWGRHKKIVCDYSFILDQAYADMTLQNKNEQAVFFNVKNEVLRQLRAPDLVIYLKCDPVILFKRIVDRGRSLEKGVTVAFLNSLTNMLEKQLKTQKDIVVIESDKINFADNSIHCKRTIDLLMNKVKDIKPI